MAADGQAAESGAGDELDALLAPISASDPVGPDLRASGMLPYRELEELLQGRGKGRGRAASQNAADALAQIIRTLLRESKDLGLACLGLQALLGARGAVGLQLGLRLLRGLHERLFKLVHPQLAPAGTPETEQSTVLVRALRERKRAIERTDAALQDQLLKLPLCPSAEGDERTYGAFWWLELDRGATDVSIEELNQVALLQPRAHYEELAETLRACARECETLNRQLDRLYGDCVREHELDLEPPLLGGTAQSLEACLKVVEALVRLCPRSADAAPSSPTRAADGGAPERDAAAPAAAPGAATFARIERYLPKDRADALQMIRGAALYLHELEPLSPVPYLLLRAVRWGRMDSLAAWLDEMLSEVPGPRERARFELGLDAGGASGTDDARAASDGLSGDGSAEPPGLRPQGRVDALVMLSDAASYLHTQEPLGPVPYLVLRALAWARSGSPEGWLAHCFTEGEAALGLIKKTLGLTERAS